MKEYEKNFEFDLENKSNLKNKLIKYFTPYNHLEVIDLNNGILIKKDWSLLDGWKLNIFNWETKIKIKFEGNNKIKINHKVMTNGFGFITPIAFSSLYEKYLQNLEKFINQNETFEHKNNELIKCGKIKMLKYITLMIFALFISIYFGSILKNVTKIDLFMYLGISIGAIIFEKIMNYYLIKKNI